VELTAEIEPGEQPLDLAQGQRRPLREFDGQLVAGVSELVVGHDLIDEAEVQRFGGPDAPAPHQQPARHPRAGQGGKENGHSPIAGQPQGTVGGDHLRARRRHPEIAGQRQAQAGPGDRPVQRRHRRAGQFEEPEDRGEGPGEPGLLGPARLRPLAPADPGPDRSVPHGDQVGPGAEGAPGFGEGDGPHARVLPQTIQFPDEGSHEIPVKSVQGVGPVQHEVDDRAAGSHQEHIVRASVLTHGRITLSIGRSNQDPDRRSGESEDHVAKAANARTATADDQRDGAGTGRPPAHEAKRREILAGAARVFYRRGFAAGTTKEIAAEVGLSQPAIYHYMGAKDDLLREIALKVDEDLMSALERGLARGSTPKEQLRAVIEEFVAAIIDNQQSFEVYLREFTSFAPDLQAKVTRDERRFMVRLANLVEQAQAEEGFAPGAKPMVAAQGIAGMVCWIFHWYRPGKELNPQGVADVLSTLIGVGR
jgi:AcrR family transcriptional regulator